MDPGGGSYSKMEIMQQQRCQHSPLQLVSAGNGFLCFYLFEVYEVEIWPCVCTLPLSSVAPNSQGLSLKHY